MSKAKRVNPRRVPATQADVERARSEAVTGTIAIIFTALLDKYSWTPEQLQALWVDVNKLSEEVGEHRVKIDDLLSVLEDEYQVTIS